MKALWRIKVDTVQPRVMGRFVITRSLTILGWSATGVIAIAVIAMFVTQLV